MLNREQTIITSFILPLAILVLCQWTVRAQEKESDGAVQQSTVEDSLFVMGKSPGGAVLRSAILPGWGQFYNESYWKIPVILAAGGYLAWGWFSNDAEYTRYSDLYDASITLQSTDGNLNYKLYRELYRDRRDTYGWLFGLLYLLQIADAFVDAHLFDFATNDHQGLSIHPAASGIGIVIRW